MQGGKYSASRSPGVIVSDATLISTPLIPGPVKPGYRRKTTIDFTLIRSIHIQTSGEPCPCPARYCDLVGTVTTFSEDYSGWWRHMVKPVPCSEVRSLIRSNAVRNTMVVAKAFSKSTESSFGRSIACWEEKCVFRVIVHSSKN